MAKTTGETTTNGPRTITRDATVVDVVRTMRDVDMRVVPIVDCDKLVGIVAQADIVQHMNDNRTGEMCGRDFEGRQAQKLRKPTRRPGVRVETTDAGVSLFRTTGGVPQCCAGG